MPIYEYECQSCGRRLETMQKMSDPPLETCTVCAGPLRKLISAPAFQFKGSGWYVTDYGRKGGEGKAAGEGKDSGTGEGGKDAGGDKPAKEKPAASGDKPAASSGASGPAKGGGGD